VLPSTAPQRAERRPPDRWANLQATNPHFDSAFYAPDLAPLVSTVRDDVEVAVMTDGGEPVGFFPFLRSPGGMARPVAGRLTEFQARSLGLGSSGI
jgi:hypothetical protein